MRFVESLGGAHYGYLDIAGEAEPVTCALAVRPAVDSEITMSLPAERLYLFDVEGCALVRPRVTPEREAA